LLSQKTNQQTTDKRFICRRTRVFRLVFARCGSSIEPPQTAGVVAAATFCFVTSSLTLRLKAVMGRIRMGTIVDASANAESKFWKSFALLRDVFLAKRVALLTAKHHITAP
jgi:hypothetical protein